MRMGSVLGAGTGKGTGQMGGFRGDEREGLAQGATSTPNCKFIADQGLGAPPCMGTWGFAIGGLSPSCRRCIADSRQLCSPPPPESVPPPIAPP